MNCCGKKRAAIQQRREIPKAEVTLVVPRTGLKFLGVGSYLVTGEHTGKAYLFSSEKPHQWIEPADVAGLLRTGFFEVHG